MGRSFRRLYGKCEIRDEEIITLEVLFGRISFEKVAGKNSVRRMGIWEVTLKSRLNVDGWPSIDDNNEFC